MAHTPKYPNECGSTVSEFGKHADRRIDGSNGDGDDAAVGVTPEQCAQIQAYITKLEEEVQDYVERHYCSQATSEDNSMGHQYVRLRRTFVQRYILGLKEVWICTECGHKLVV